MKNRKEKNQIFINVEGFLKVAMLPETQEILARIKLFPEVLEEGQTLLNSWKSRRISLDASWESAREKTREKHALKERVARDIRTLSGLARARFYADDEVLGELNLRTQRASVPVQADHSEEEATSVASDGSAPDGSAPDGSIQDGSTPDDSSSEETVLQAVRKTREERNQVTHWRRLVQGVFRLPGHKRSVFEKFGYNDEVLNGLLMDLDALVSAVGVQKQGLLARKSQVAGLSRVERELMIWVNCVRTVLRNNRDQLGPDEPSVLAMAGEL